MTARLALAYRCSASARPCGRTLVSAKLRLDVEPPRDVAVLLIPGLVG